MILSYEYDKLIDKLNEDRLSLWDFDVFKDYLNKKGTSENKLI